ncbi:DUF805 domain-containing protein [Pseudomonas cerasi]|uniref:Membrane protein n=1 Tax=Pseudomonas cerasi TaxID=1583341 RepID=A0A193SHT0_9PSED|nr:DUF805 domain-containing protein [Pseudomonas cerasi]CZT26585.1 membrane protein [Pseudomonas cerasi]SOS14168.1 membrane protein [Pseudomonas cerasi]
MVFCRGCAKEISDDAGTCPHCGAPQLVVSPASASTDNPPAWSWYTDVLKKYAVFTGRARRKEYWMFFLFNILISIVLGFIGGLIGDGGIIANLYSLAVLVPGIAVGVRRLHDTDRSGWWLLVPIANLVFLIQEGHPGPNRFGPGPK